MSTPFDPPPRRRLPLVALAGIVALLVLASGVVAYLALGRGLFTPARTTFGDAMAVGQCYNPGDATTVTEVPCSEPHDYEVYAVGTLDGDPAWTQAQIDKAGESFCADAADRVALSGAAADSADYVVGNATAADWAKGDRSVDCAIGLGRRTTGSLLKR